jgi:DNA polymerase bacteriophage-type
MPMSDILDLLDSVVDRVGERRRKDFPQFPSQDASRSDTGTPKILIENLLPAFPVVPVAGEVIDVGTNSNIASTTWELKGPDESAPLTLSFRSTGNTGPTGNPEESCGSPSSRDGDGDGNSGNTATARQYSTVNLAEVGLVIDFETRSTANLKEVGPFVYADGTWTQVWVACYAIGNGPVQVWHPGDPVPAALGAHVAAGLPLVAHNSLFERTIWAKIMTPRHGWPETRLEQWYCTAAMAAAMGLPRKLEDVAKHFEGVPQKDMDGHRLMRQMARPASTEEIPCPFCGAGSGEPPARPDCVCQHDIGWRRQVTWYEEAGAIERCTNYCIRDVEVERALLAKLGPLSPAEREVWLLDQRTNERGVSVDLDLARKAQGIVKSRLAELDTELKDVTANAVGAATQVARLTAWLKSRGVELTGDGNELGKVEVERLLAQTDLPPDCRRALEIRREAAQTSMAKLDAYIARTSADGRMRDNLLYCGAGRTGRWAGKGAQLQNLPRRSPDISQCFVDLAMLMISAGGTIRDLERMFSGQTLEVIAACLRPMLTAAAGHDLIGADYNAIEARGTAWLAGAQHMLGIFQRGEDPYLDMAAQIYGRPAESFSKSGPERQLGKAAVLGLGYQMGAERFKETCETQGVPISIEEAKRVTQVYREFNPEIVQLWTNLQNAGIESVQHPDVPVHAADGRLIFVRRGTWLYLRLPSGRYLSYARPHFEPIGRRVTFEGVNSVTKKWERQQIYGGKWCENAVQAICRDLLAQALVRLEAAGYPVVLSVHDEAIAEVPEGFGDVAAFERIMCQLPDWAVGLPLKAEGWRATHYE